MNWNARYLAHKDWSRTTYYGLPHPTETDGGYGSPYTDSVYKQDPNKVLRVCGRCGVNIEPSLNTYPHPNYSASLCSGCNAVETGNRLRDR